jgi:mannose-6-phosphate isomerase-like protein (cupin superfamily)
MAALNEDDLREALRAQGFRRIYVWQDGDNAYYAEHTHPTETAHIVLSGEMTLTMNGALRTYKPGERCDVPAGAAHCARMGPSGCRYLIGER